MITDDESDALELSLAGLISSAGMLRYVADVVLNRPVTDEEFQEWLTEYHRRNPGKFGDLLGSIVRDY